MPELISKNRIKTFDGLYWLSPAGCPAPLRPSQFEGETKGVPLLCWTPSASGRKWYPTCSDWLRLIAARIVLLLSCRGCIPIFWIWRGVWFREPLPTVFEARIINIARIHCALSFLYWKSFNPTRFSKT